MNGLYVLGGWGALAGALWAASAVTKTRRARFIRSFAWSPEVLAALDRRRPGLGSAERARIGQALKHFFLACLAHNRAYVAMPSRAADELWHAFILETRAYAAFCQEAFGAFLHHAPAARPPAGAETDLEQNLRAGFRRAWWFACWVEGLNPHKPARLPLLFALDAELGLADGFRYDTDGASLWRARWTETGREIRDALLDLADAGDGGGGSDGDGHGGGDGGDGGGGDGCGGGCGGGD